MSRRTAESVVLDRSMLIGDRRRGWREIHQPNGSKAIGKDRGGPQNSADLWSGLAHQTGEPVLMGIEKNENGRQAAHRMRNKEVKMKQGILLVLAVLVILLAGCGPDRGASGPGSGSVVVRDNRVSITGSGNLVSQEKALSGFDRVETGFAFNVTILKGEGFSVVVSADDNLADYLQVDKVGSTLRIGLKPGYAYDIPQATMQAQVTMPELAGLRLGESSHATLSGFRSVEAFEAELSGSSSLRGELEADASTFALSGSTYVKLAGSGRNLSLEACGNSTIDLSDYRVEDAALRASCASTALVNVRGRLDVDASQNARVYYIGWPAAGDILAHENATVQPKR